MVEDTGNIPASTLKGILYARYIAAIRPSDGCIRRESECRVCRDTATESEPLLSPCKCDGSIKVCSRVLLVEVVEREKD